MAPELATLRPGCCKEFRREGHAQERRYCMRRVPLSRRLLHSLTSSWPGRSLRPFSPQKGQGDRLAKAVMRHLRDRSRSVGVAPVGPNRRLRARPCQRQDTPGAKVEPNLAEQGRKTVPNFVPHRGNRSVVPHDKPKQHVPGKSTRTSALMRASKADRRFALTRRWRRGYSNCRSHRTKSLVSRRNEEVCLRAFPASGSANGTCSSNSLSSSDEAVRTGGPVCVSPFEGCREGRGRPGQS